MFLSLDKTARRKLQETFVTYRMEHEFTKQEIFGLYLNVIFFGQRSYGVAAAAEAFFGKSARQARRRRGRDDRRRAQGALALQPHRRPAAGHLAPRLRAAAHARAELHRRGHRGGRQQGADAGARRTRRCTTSRPRTSPRWRAWSCASASGPTAESAGYKVYTTIDGRLQGDANRAVRVGLIEYDRRHGWRGPAGHVELADARRHQLRGAGR